MVVYFSPESSHLTCRQAACRSPTRSLGWCTDSLGHSGAGVLSIAPLILREVPIADATSQANTSCGPALTLVRHDRRGMLHGPHGALCAAMLAVGCDVNVRALKERSPGSDALARYDTVARVMTGDPAATAADGVKWIRVRFHGLS